jgi:hypothetical protein
MAASIAAATVAFLSAYVTARRAAHVDTLVARRDD